MPKLEKRKAQVHNFPFVVTPKHIAWGKLVPSDNDTPRRGHGTRMHRQSPFVHSGEMRALANHVGEHQTWMQKRLLEHAAVHELHVRKVRETVESLNTNIAQQLSSTTSVLANGNTQCGYNLRQTNMAHTAHL